MSKEEGEVLLYIRSKEVECEHVKEEVSPASVNKAVCEKAVVLPAVVGVEGVKEGSAQKAFYIKAYEADNYSCGN